MKKIIDIIKEIQKPAHLIYLTLLQLIGILALLFIFYNPECWKAYMVISLISFTTPIIKLLIENISELTIGKYKIKLKEEIENKMDELQDLATLTLKASITLMTTKGTPEGMSDIEDYISEVENLIKQIGIEDKAEEIFQEYHSNNLFKYYQSLAIAAHNNLNRLKPEGYKEKMTTVLSNYWEKNDKNNLKPETFKKYLEEIGVVFDDNMEKTFSELEDFYNKKQKRLNS